jgi:L-iditol 2-dehydrogenase
LSSRAVKLPDHVAFDEASLVEPLACCIHSIKKARLTIGQTIAIIGFGTMGVIHLLLARMMGARVAVVELDEQRLDLARELRSDVVVNARSEDPVHVVKHHTSGRGADAVIVAAATREAGEQGFAMAGPLGRVVFYASTHPPQSLSFDWNRIHYDEIVVTGSAGKTHRDFQEAARLLGGKQISLRRLISKTIPLADLPEELGSHPTGATQRVVVTH